ncbi:p21-activated protein kinase-interacting protein 1-like [Dysidea avara]|uniref:p21-activated protein kinase-interacting protein 1-like n=1 Tax=Dysidea avara TaxID=196820 RepID=UPI00332924EC
MEIEIIIGTYDCFIKGYSFDLISTDQNIRSKFYEKSHTGCLKAVACNGRYLASGSTDETIKLYDLQDHTEVGTLVQHEGTITELVFFGGTHLVSASEDQTICIWECGNNWDCLHVLKGHKGRINSVSIHPSGKLALSVAKDKTLRMWNLLTGRMSYVNNLKQVAELVVWNPVGDQYVVAYDTTLSVCDVQSGSVTQNISIGKHINAVQYIKEKILAIASELPYIQLYSVVTGKCLYKLEGHTNRVKTLIMAPGNSFLFSASSDGTIRAWKMDENLSLCSCVCHVDTKSRPTCMTLSNLAVKMEPPSTTVQPTEESKQLTKAAKSDTKSRKRKTEQKSCTETEDTTKELHKKTRQH